MTLSSQYPAIIAKSPAAVVPKRDRRRSLTRIDARSTLGKRIADLKALFTEALGADAMTPMKREKIGEAAQLQAMAESERGAWMRGEAKCNLDELVRLERRAQQAVKALRIEESKPTGPGGGGGGGGGGEEG
jgi:hypothetical protein